MKKFLLSVLVSLGLLASAVAQIGAYDQYVGYDGDCRIFWRPYYGYYRVCNYGSPFYIGWEINQWTTWNSRHHYYWEGHRNWQHGGGYRGHGGNHHSHGGHRH